MKPSSNDLRRALSAAYETNDYSQHDVADLFGVSPATVRTLVRRQRETGTPAAKPRGGGKPARLSPPARDRGRQLLATRHDVPLAEVCQQSAQA